MEHLPHSPYVALDLEFNQPSGRIIQIGAVIGRVDTSELLSRFSAYVNPGETLCPRIAALCGAQLLSTKEKGYPDYRVEIMAVTRPLPGEERMPVGVAPSSFLRSNVFQ